MQKYLSPAVIRETIESVIVAIVLALLIRTFEAEAFVIPTGSMAPALMGAHKDLVCPYCGCPYQVSGAKSSGPDGDSVPAVVQTRHSPGMPPAGRSEGQIAADLQRGPRPGRQVLLSAQSPGQDLRAL